MMNPSFFDEIGNWKTATTNSRVSTYPPTPSTRSPPAPSPRAFDIIGKANTTTNTGKIHIPSTVAATDGNGTTSRDGGKFLPAPPETFIHDFNGNLTSDGRFTYTWDAENRLIAMETHSTTPLPARRKLAFSYDALNRRISKTVWHGTSGGGWQLHHKFDFIHELGGWNILAERSGGSKDSFLRTYTWGTDLSDTLNGTGGVGGLLFTKLQTSGKSFAYGMDLNGNVTLLVNTATSQSGATYDYGPFGEALRQSGEYAALNPFRFSTKYTDDETGFLDFGLRIYRPLNGGWLSRDPIEEKGGLNLYAFVGNRPIQNVDINGERPRFEDNTKPGKPESGDGHVQFIPSKIATKLSPCEDSDCSKVIWDDDNSLGAVKGYMGINEVHESVHVRDAKKSYELSLKEIEMTYLEKCMNHRKASCYNDLSSLFGSLAQAYYAVLSNSFHVNGTHGPDGKKIEGGYFNWDLAKAKSDLAKSQRIYNEQKSKLEEKLEKCANIQ